MEISLSIFAALILIYPAWKIFRKSGMHPAWSLFLFFPIAGVLICLMVLAFSTWPGIRNNLVGDNDGNH